jgi:hypothetical protein
MGSPQESRISRQKRVAIMPFQTNMQQDSSLLHWFPKIKDLLPVPNTEVLQLTDEQVYDIVGLLDGDSFPAVLQDDIIHSAGKFGYPLFLRTDQGSAKHDYAHSCHVENEEQLLGHLACLFEWHLIHDLWPRAIVFRELLQLNAPFKAFDGLPIAKERRYFVDEGKVLCHHPYWPEGAIETGRGAKSPPANWQELLADINQEDDAEIACLTEMAERFSAAVPGFYSVDFAQAIGGKWYMIDAARGELSWHPEHDVEARL